MQKKMERGDCQEHLPFIFGRDPTRCPMILIRKTKRSQESLSMKTFLGVGVLSPRRSEALTTSFQASKRLVMCGIRISTGKLGSCGSSASRQAAAFGDRKAGHSFTPWSRSKDGTPG